MTLIWMYWHDIDMDWYDIDMNRVIWHWYEWIISTLWGREEFLSPSPINPRFLRRTFSQKLNFIFQILIGYKYFPSLSSHVNLPLTALSILFSIFNIIKDKKLPVTTIQYSTVRTIQVIHKRMVRYQKWIKSVFLTLHGTTYTVSGSNCPSFSFGNYNPSMYAPWVTRHTSTR
jgi:hypothetical protein